MRYARRVSRDREAAGARARPEAQREAPRRDRERGERPGIDERASGALRDAGAYRVVAVKDLIDCRFGGNRFAAMATLRRLERAGMLRIAKAKGPRGGEFQVAGLTVRGRQRMEASGGEQRWWTGRQDVRQASHDAAVYRAAAAEEARVREAGGRVTRVRIDAEFRSIVARRVERARAAGGAAAAEAEADRLAGELGLSREGGKFHYPDARVEYVDAEGRAGGVDVEVTTAHYRSGTIRAKAAAGMALHAAGRSAARAAGLGRSGGLGGLGSGGAAGGGGGGGRGDEGLLDL